MTSSCPRCPWTSPEPLPPHFSLPTWTPQAAPHLSGLRISRGTWRPLCLCNGRGRTMPGQGWVSRGSIPSLGRQLLFPQLVLRNLSRVENPMSSHCMKLPTSCSTSDFSQINSILILGQQVLPLLVYSPHLHESVRFG